MRKSIKIVLTTLLAFMLLFSFAQPVVFADDVSTITSDVSTITSGLTKDKVDPANSGATEIASKIISWIWIISVIVAVVVLMYTGLKFIVGSTQEKAEYKKSLVPIVVGVAILVFATTIVNVLFSLGGN